MDNRTDECQACFNTWCWNGQDDDSEPATYEPTVGSVPQWLVANNLASASSSEAPAQSSQANTETSQSPSSAGKVELMGGWTVAVALISVFGGALSVMF